MANTWTPVTSSQSQCCARYIGQDLWVIICMNKISKGSLVSFYTCMHILINIMHMTVDKEITEHLGRINVPCYSGRKAARVRKFFLFFFCVAIGQEITHKTSYMTK